MRLRESLFVACAFALVLFVWLAGLGGETWIEWFAGHRPFAGRLLSFWLMAVLRTVLPFWSAAALIGAASLGGYMAALHWLGVRSYLHLSAGLLAPIPLMVNGSHLYDLPTLAFSALALAGLVRRHGPLLWIAFVLWTLNRETALLILLVLLVRDRGVSYELLALGAAYALIRFVIGQAQAGLPAITLIFSLPMQLHAIKEQMPFAIMYAFALAAPLAMVLHRWQTKPLELRWAFALSLGVLFGLYWIMGYPFELRVLHESVPSGVLLALHSLWGHNEANRKPADERQNDRMAIITPL